MSKTIRIRTTPNGDDKFIKINMEQDFDFVEILCVFKSSLYKHLIPQIIAYYSLLN